MLVSEPKQIIDVTINHLNGIRQVAGYDEEIMTSVKYAHEQVRHFKDVVG
jgi:hypothetical protein